MLVLLLASLYYFWHAVAGGPAVTGFPAVEGVIAVASVHADPGVHILAESVATLPPFSPIEGQKWFDQISSQ